MLKAVFIVIGVVLLGCIIGLSCHYFSPYQRALRELKSLGVITTEADVNRARNDGATPLYLAAESGQSEIVLMLKAAGAKK